jgi:hypothetical protein
VRRRQADRDPTIVLVAELPTILPHHADRVLALLGSAGVVDDQGPDRAALFDEGQDTGTHRREHRLIGPIGLGPRSDAETGALLAEPPAARARPSV